MRPYRFVFSVVTAVALGATAAQASDPAPAADSVQVVPNPPAAPAPPASSATGAAATPVIAVQRHQRSPLAAELDAVLAAERTLLQRLEREVRLAAGSEAALALQRQIAQVKQNTEIELLRVQARHARRVGRIEVAEQIEAAVRELLMTPEERAAAEKARASAPAAAPREE